MPESIKTVIGLVLLLSIVNIVSGINLNFQNPPDFAAQINAITYNGGNLFASPASSISWTQNSTGGNNYIKTTSALNSPGTSRAGYYIINPNANPSSYAAATLLNFNSNGDSGAFGPSASVNTVLFDSSGTPYLILPYPVGQTSLYNIPTPIKVEFKIINGQGFLYINGTNVNSTGQLGINPSYIGFGCSVGGTGFGAVGLDCKWDDYIYGSNENQYAFDAPLSPYFIIKKDLANPLDDGFAFANGTIISSHYIPMGFSKSTNNPETVVLADNYGFGTGWTSYNTTNNMFGNDIPISLDNFINSSAPPGFYAFTIPGSNQRSNVFAYESTGASVNFDKPVYSIGDTAIASYNISFFDTSNYRYNFILQDVFGNTYVNQSLSLASGTENYTFNQTNFLGQYFGQLYAYPNAGGNASFLGYGITSLSGYIRLSGYVNNAFNGSPISGANINLTQGVLSQTVNSLPDGSWNNSALITTGSPIYINTTASGYQSDTDSFTPIQSKSILLNISLIPSVPACSIGGVCLNGIVKRTPYFNPVPNAQVIVNNTTSSEYYTLITNNQGYYEKANLTNLRWYYISALSGAGYLNSTIDFKQVTGS